MSEDPAIYGKAVLREEDSSRLLCVAETLSSFFIPSGDKKAVGRYFVGMWTGMGE